MKKLSVIFLLIILTILIINATSCIDGGNGNTNVGSLSATATSLPPFAVQATQSANATATYGAEQFHIQLTAIAEQEQSNTP
jgi:hypothetical protein